jgi:hypothetical protein
MPEAEGILAQVMVLEDQSPPVTICASTVLPVDVPEVIRRVILVAGIEDPVGIVGILVNLTNARALAPLFLPMYSRSRLRFWTPEPSRTEVLPDADRPISDISIMKTLLSLL